MGDRLDDEVEAALAHPKMTYALAEKVKRYPAWARAKMTSHAHQTATLWWEEVKTKTSELLPRLDAAQDRYDEIEAALDAGTMTAVEAVEAMNTLRASVAAEERRYEALSRQHARADQVHADPVGHMEHLYETYPALAENRPTLGDYLAQSSRPPSDGLGLHGRLT
ncbi:hypothetical protein BHE97_15285 [Aeromicrobium sp. PE09-221]|uniref:hypothetical protein n=1 Tax=Aeromicrobium sp. PE09-221 TaxID=1898043 RepID=UPI000B3E4C7E|nr:hypothetical protein [Aeromicrobium sp. PE09-221]OUZ07752.1 hypothetical protein BHE97_15285 [Aeromicrobium sp. PE09-221]